MTSSADQLTVAREAVADLEADASRVDELASGAEHAAGEARGDPKRLPDLAARATGLRQAHAGVLADLEAARARLADLERAEQRQADEAELLDLDALAEQLRDDTVVELRAALDAALTRLATVARLERERRSAHHRATELRRKHDLNPPARRLDGSDRSWRDLRPADAAHLPDALPADERGLYAVWGLRSHPLAQGTTRPELVTERDAAAREHAVWQERADLTRAQRQWDARALIVERAAEGRTSTDPDLVAQYRAWLAQNPRPA